MPVMGIGGLSWNDILWLFGLPLFFIALLIFMQWSRQRKHKKLLDELKVNDRVVTVGGLVGRIEKFKDETLILRVDEKTRVEVVKEGIYRKMD